MNAGRWFLITCCLGVAGAPVSGQSVRSLVREGNTQYEDRQYDNAEVSYRKALEKEGGLVAGHYNLGNALYRQQKVDEAVREYENAALKTEERETRAGAYYNMGNAFMKGQRYQDAVNSYIESLRLKPGDQDAKYNLSYALEKLKEQQQNKSDKNKDGKQDKQKDQQKQDQKDQQQQQNDQQQQPKDQPQGQEKQMAKADAERMLEVLKNSEKEVQKKLRVRPAQRSRTERDW